MNVYVVAFMDDPCRPECWRCCGVFTTREAAEALCTDCRFQIAVVPLDKVYREPDDNGEVPETFQPNRTCFLNPGGECPNRHRQKVLAHADPGGVSLR